VAVVNQVGDQPAQGIGFAIPVRLVEEALSDILPTEFVKSYWFGARVKVGSYPLIITSVQPDSPAGRAGIRVGDVLLQVNGKVPKNFIEFGDLLSTNARNEVALTIRRDGELKEFKLQLVPISTVFNANMVREKLGLTLDLLTQQVAASRYRLNASGFIVKSVEEKSPAGDAGFQPGMLIVGVDGQTVNDVTTLAKMLYAKKKGEPIQLNVRMPQRAGAFVFLGEGTVELVPR
jgi:serine protease Do